MSNAALSFFRSAAVAALFSGSLLSGCAYGEMPQVLRAQVASEVKCPDITVRQAPAYTPGFNGDQYKVQGCGIDRVYTCKDSGGMVKYGKADCTYVAASAPKPDAAGPAPAAEPDADGLDDGNG